MTKTKTKDSGLKKASKRATVVPVETVTNPSNGDGDSDMSKYLVERDIYHLEIQDDLNALKEYMYHNDLDLNSAFTISRYVSTGKPKVMYKKDVVVMCKNRVYLIRNGKVLLSACKLFHAIEFELLEQRLSTAELVGVVLPKPFGNMGYALGLINNGDEGSNYLVEETDLTVPAISFRCLGRFYDDLTTEATATRLVSGECKVVDFTPDESRRLTKEDKTAREAYKKYESELNAGNTPKKKVATETARAWFRHALR